MRFEREMVRLYAVTDRTWLRGRTLEEVVEEALRGGVTMVQLREKELPHEAIVSEARQLTALCHRYGVPLLVDDDVAACVEAGADGVHVGQSDMAVSRARAVVGPEHIIGATAHNEEEAVRAQADGADYIGSGAAFGSLTKKDARPIDRKEYRRITAAVTIPVCAIGGITQNNIGELNDAGLAGAAIVSGIFAAEDITKTCLTLKNLSLRL